MERHDVAEADVPDDLLTAAQEVELAQQIEAGLYAEHLLNTNTGDYDRALLQAAAREGRDAFARFVTANHRLATWWAKRRVAAGAAAGQSSEDLASEGMLGVVRSVQKFDYTLGYKFSTYASNWIRNFQQRAVIAAAPATMDPRDHELAMQVIGTEQLLTAQLRRTPSPAEVAQQLDTTVKAVERVKAMMRPALSLDRPLPGDDGRTVAELVLVAYEPESTDSGAATAQRLEGMMRTLSQRERAMVAEVFGLHSGRPRSIAEVAHTRELSSQQIGELVGSALQKMGRSTSLTPAA